MTPAPRSILAIGAHPDDIEFGCGAVLAREAEQGRFAHFVIATRGESSSHGTPPERVAEAERAAAELGATVEFLNLGTDAHLEPTIASALRLAGVIRQQQPTWLLAPTLVENQHPDHLAVAQLARQAARLARYGGVAELRGSAAHAIGTFLSYAITVEAEPSNAQPIVIDLVDAQVVDRWRRAMAHHATQMRTRNYSELQLTRARLHGLRAGVEYAWPLWPAESLVFDSLQPTGRSARRF